MDTPDPDLDAQMLAELAEMDLSATKHVHARLIAATEPDEVADMARAYGRVSRMLRQTLALKAKLAQDAARSQPLASGPAWARGVPPTPGCLSAQGFRVDDRVMELQAAVDRVLDVEIDDPLRYEALIERLDRELDDWVLEDDFADVPLDAQVLRVCRRLGLSEDLAARWRELPEPSRDWADLPDEDQDSPGFNAAPPPGVDTG